MSKVFYLDTCGFRFGVLQADFMLDYLTNIAKQTAETAGDGYAYSSEIGRNRALAMAYTDTPKAMRDNNRNNTLLKASPVRVK